jgi:RNA polymerase-associated protein RTF1
MADLDAELLALAGGDDSSGEESMPSSPKQKSPSRSPSPPRSKKPSRESPPPDMARKGVAKTVKRVKRRKNYSDDDDEVYDLVAADMKASANLF